MTTAIELPSINRTVSISDFSKGKASRIFKEAHDAPVFVLNRNKSISVILDIDQYKALQEYLEDIEDEQLAMERLERWEKSGEKTFTRDESMLDAGITQADIDAAPDVEIE